jgi:hypothetical protein
MVATCCDRLPHRGVVDRLAVGKNPNLCLRYIIHSPDIRHEESESTKGHLPNQPYVIWNVLLKPSDVLQAFL